MAGKEVFSKKFQATVSFTEGLATLDLKNLNNPNFLKQANESISLLNLTIDATSLPENLKGLLPTNGKLLLPMMPNNKAVIDKTYMAPRVQVLKLPTEKSEKKETKETKN